MLAAERRHVGEPFLSESRVGVVVKIDGAFAADLTADRLAIAAFPVSFLESLPVLASKVLAVGLESEAVKLGAE